ncbi:MAG: YiiX/YebB-like N1pC/P60 family cysteine hydrolase, partial [Candidatus Cloacimonadota bacterium]|nr:YiiX/YebB-like N1pC/P60 family cysteine hydrolase [Candidatus Cloacimonadota bacterium]
KYTVIEASSTVREIPLETWIQNGINGEYAIFRYNMNESDSKKVVENARKFLGIPYDVQFHPSDNKMYCSELVYKAFDRALGVKIGKEENISKFIEKASKVKSQKLEKMISSRFRGKLPNHNLVTPVSQTDYLKRIKTTYDGKNE